MVFFHAAIEMAILRGPRDNTAPPPLRHKISNALPYLVDAVQESKTRFRMDSIRWQSNVLTR